MRCEHIRSLRGMGGKARWALLCKLYATWELDEWLLRAIEPQNFAGSGVSSTQGAIMSKWVEIRCTCQRDAHPGRYAFAPRSFEDGRHR